MASVLSYAPSYQNDELLYSWVGWAIKLNALGSPRYVAERLFGDRYAMPVPDLPSRLQTLHSRLDRMSPAQSANDLIFNTTLFPYHRSFLTPSRAQSLHQTMLSTDGRGIKTFAGRVANRFGARHELRFCPTCLAEDHSKSLRPYWRRRHQLPGVWCCLQHRCMLVPLSRTTSLSRGEFWLPDKFAYSQIKPSKCTDQQLWFAKISARLLDVSPYPIPPLIRRAVYRTAIASIGCSSSRGAPDCEALARSIRAHYSNFVEFEHQSRLLATDRYPLAWLRTAVDRPERSLHPICHLLLIGFLFPTFDAYLERLQQFDIIVTDPVTQNKERDRARLSTDDMKLMLDTTLSCRTVAARIKLSTNSVVLARRDLGLHSKLRPKLLRGDKLRVILHDLQGGKDLQSIATVHEISLISLYRLLRMHPEVADQRRKMIQELNLAWRRDLWEAALHSAGKRGISGAREREGATYAWLRRHDHEWFKYHKPERRSIAVRRVDWGARDSAVLNSLSGLAEHHLSFPNRPRMSQTYWLKLLGKENMIRRNLKNLPLTSGLLSELHETTEDFCTRRILRTIHDFRSKGIPLVPWRIQRAAGVRVLSPQLRIVIDDATKREIPKDYFN